MIANLIGSQWRPDPARESDSQTSMPASLSRPIRLSLRGGSGMGRTASARTIESRSVLTLSPTGI